MHKIEGESIIHKCRTLKRKTKTFACTCCCCCYLFSGAWKYFPSYNVKMAFNHNCAMHWLFSLVLKSEVRHSTTQQQTAETLRLSEHIFNSFIRICIVLQLSLQLKHHYTIAAREALSSRLREFLRLRYSLNLALSVGPKQVFFFLLFRFWAPGQRGFGFSLLLLTYEYARGVCKLFITDLARPAPSHISNVLHRGVGLSQLSSPRTFEQGRSRQGLMHAPLLVFHGTFKFAKARSDRVALGASGVRSDTELATDYRNRKNVGQGLGSIHRLLNRFWDVGVALKSRGRWMWACWGRKIKLEHFGRE